MAATVMPTGEWASNVPVTAMTREEWRICVV